jgi:DNA-binding MarR family transcriptional regulator
MAKRAAIADFMLQEAPGHLLRRCQQRAIELYVQEVGEDGPTPRQFAVLLSIGQNPGVNQIDLVRLTGIDRSTMAELISRLLKRALIRRRRTAADGRANELHLTAAGSDLVAAVLPAVRRAQARILAPLPAAKRAALVRALQVLVEAEEAID